MLNGSVILRIAMLLIAAAGVTALVRYYIGHDGGLPEAQLAASTAPTVEPRRAEPVPPPARDITPTAPSPPPPGPSAAATPAPPPQPPPSEAPVTLQPPPESEPAAPQAEAASPAAIDLVDLNTGSVAQLNALKGGGAIGRTIVQHRPYASVDQLLGKRVLSRATYQRIKTQVTVR